MESFDSPRAPEVGRGKNPPRPTHATQPHALSGGTFGEAPARLGAPRFGSMHPQQMDEIVRRLVANPHDEGALATAHQAGQHDPRGYAMLLERVGDLSNDTTYAAHWLSEAANVWAVTIGDARRAATLLMRAIEKDPTSDVAADRLAQLYREKNDARALVALYERRAKALAPVAANDARSEEHTS